jgi:hypothetical protein
MAMVKFERVTAGEDQTLNGSRCGSEAGVRLCQQQARGNTPN